MHEAWDVTGDIPGVGLQRCHIVQTSLQLSLANVSHGRRKSSASWILAPRVSFAADGHLTMWIVGTFLRSFLLGSRCRVQSVVIHEQSIIFIREIKHPDTFSQLTPRFIDTSTVIKEAFEHHWLIDAGLKRPSLTEEISRHICSVDFTLLRGLFFWRPVNGPELTPFEA